MLSESLHPNRLVAGSFASPSRDLLQIGFRLYPLPNNAITGKAGDIGFIQRNGWFGRSYRQTVKLSDFVSHPEVGIIDVLNVKSDPLLIGSLRGQDGYFPAYHMNKEKWLSIQLGKPELDDAIKDLLSLSHELTAPKKRNRKLPANNPGDSANGKEKETDKG